jgi:hypothetical protein
MLKFAHASRYASFFLLLSCKRVENLLQGRLAHLCMDMIMSHV